MSRLEYMYNLIEYLLHDMEMEYGNAVKSMESYWQGYELLDEYDSEMWNYSLIKRMEDYCYAMAS